MQSESSPQARLRLLAGSALVSQLEACTGELWKLTPFFRTVAIQGMITKAEIFILIGAGIDNGKGGSGFSIDVGEVVEDGGNAWR